MENLAQKKIINKIKSSYIILGLFDYISDANFKFKIFSYSKLYQKKLNIELYDFQKIYFSKYEIDLDQFLILKTFKFNDKNYLKTFFNTILINNNIDFNIIKSYIINYYKNKAKNQNNTEKDTNSNTKISIDIYSPFFEILSDSEIFEQYFMVLVPIVEIKKNNLENDYISCFEKLNKVKSKYSSIKIIFKENEDVHFMYKLIKNFEQINELYLLKNGRSSNYNFNNFFKSLFTMNGIDKNLKALDINIYDSNSDIYLDANSLENLNNFSSLEKLKLNSFHFNDTFTLKLYNLKEINLNRCSNVTFGEKNFKTKTVIMSNCLITEANPLIILPELEVCELSNYIDKFKYSSFFDFAKFNKLNFLKCETCDFINLSDNSKVKKVELYSKIEKSVDNEKKMIEKFFRLKNLKEINFQLYLINFDEISKIVGSNTSIKNMTVNIENINNIKGHNIKLCDLLDKIQNLSDLNIIIKEGIKRKEGNLKIIENKNSTIENIFIKGGGYNNLELYCTAFENLKSITITDTGKIKNISSVFPFFSKNCKVIFKSLTIFKYYNSEMELDMFVNLCNNLNKMPNLKKFSFDCIVNDMNKKCYENCIIKLLSFKLDDIDLNMRIDQIENGGDDEDEEEKEENEDEEDFDSKFKYSEKELLKLCPEMKRSNNYYISKIINNAYN